MENKAICAKCKYHLLDWWSYTCVNVHICKKHCSIDPVTGDNIYTHNCSEINGHGECKDFEPSLWTRIKNFLK